MNFEIDNATPLPALVESQATIDGAPAALVIVKGTWRLDTGRLAAAEHQAGLHAMPVSRRIGDLDLEPVQRQAMARRSDEQIVWQAAETSPPKGRFDVVVIGHVYASSGLQHRMDGVVSIGTRSMTVRAFAPRRWHYRALIGSRLVPAEHGVRRVPVNYAFAAWELGLGQHMADGTPQWLPWLEDPKQPTWRRGHPPRPWAFSAWPENAAHRLPHAGTHDDAWQRERAPLRPKVFDSRFYNVAHPQMQWPAAPTAGTSIRLEGLAPKPTDTRYPDLQLAAEVQAGDSATRVALRADTLLIEPDDNRLSLIWRALVPVDAPAGSRGAVRIERMNDS